MYAAQHLLPNEKRSRKVNPSVDEVTPANTPRSVRSIRRQFESSYSSNQTDPNPITQKPTSSSAPVTPAKRHPTSTNKNKQRTHQTKTQAELAAFLKAGTQSQNDPNGANKLVASSSATVGSLIQKWSSSHSVPRMADPHSQQHPDRKPLLERHVQKGDDPRHTPAAALDSVDTFGSSSVEIESQIPKTDPGRLESYAKQMRNVQHAADAVVSGDTSLREMVAKGLQQKGKRQMAATPVNGKRPQALQQRGKQSGDRPHPNHSPPVNNHPLSSPEFQTSVVSSQSEAGSAPGSAASGSSPIDEEQDHEESVIAGSDWGAGDVYIRELFAEAENTAEKAVECDENEEYFKAFGLYWVVVDLYYKVIPFLDPKEGVDVYERIKMYTRRCEAIREAFDGDPEGQDEMEERIHDAALQSAQKEEQLQESFNAGVWNSQVQNVERTDVVFQSRQALNTAQHHHSPHSLPSRNTAARPPLQHSASHAQLPQYRQQPRQHQRITQSKSQVSLRYQPSSDEQQSHVNKAAKQMEREPSRVHERPHAENPAADALQRARFPDYNNEKPINDIPEAPRPGATGLSDSTKAHRSSLSRPISRTAIRASTSSMSRERVAEMQERVRVMQECLNNFTVKRKHLGTARALELHVTTLNANTFGEFKRLEPLAPELEHKWATELEVLLSMLQEIKEVQPGVGYTLRDDIARHLPALERCDRSVRKTMRSLVALAGHVTYVDRGSAGDSGQERSRKWWVQVPVVQRGGLPSDVFRIVEEAEREMRGVFKVCHEINIEVVKSIPVPASFVERLPKHAKQIINPELKEGLTSWGMFKVSDYMKDRNLWSKEAAKKITSDLEKVALIWEAKTSNKSFFSRTFDIRGERFHQAMTAFRRCQNAIRDLRREWPTMQHTDLDMAKIESNEDIGFAGLEAYSRALESRAYRLLTRIRELLEVDRQEKLSYGITSKTSENGKIPS